MVAENAQQHEEAVQSSLASQLFKLFDKDPSDRRSSMEAIKELIHKELSQHNVPLFIGALLGPMDKKSKHHLHSVDSPHIAYIVALLLLELCCVAAHKHVTMRPSDIANIMRSIVSWFPLDNSTSSHSVHQACAKVVCSLSKIDPKEPLSTPTLSVGTSDTSKTEASSSSHETCLMETICVPLISALSSKVAPVTSGATTCLEALVSTASWNLAPPTLVHELCFKASMAVQESSALSVNGAQLSLLSTLSKANPESFNSYKVGLLKKASDVLLHSEAWQQRAAAARLMESLLSMGAQHFRSDRQGLRHTKQAIEVLERCRLDKVATVRRVVGEALKTINQLGMGKLHKELDGSFKHKGLSRSGSMKAAKGEGKKRRNKPYEKHPTLVSLARIKTSSLFTSSSGTPSIFWSSSDSASSSSTLESGSSITKESNGKEKSKHAAARNHRISGATPSPSSWHFTPRSISLSSVASSPTSEEAKPREHGGRSPLCLTTQAHPASLYLAPVNDPVKAKEQLSTNLVCSIISSIEETKENALPWTSKGDSLCMEPSSSPRTESRNMEGPNGGSDTSRHIETSPMHWSSPPSNIRYNSLAQMESVEEIMTPQVSNTGMKQGDFLLFATPKSLVTSSRLPGENAAVGAELDILSELKSDLFNDAVWTVRDNPIAMTDEKELNLQTCNACYPLSLKKDHPLHNWHLNEEQNDQSDITCKEADEGHGSTQRVSFQQIGPGEPDESLNGESVIIGRQLHDDDDDNHMHASIRDHFSHSLYYGTGHFPPPEPLDASSVISDDPPDDLYYYGDCLQGQLSTEHVQEGYGDSHCDVVAHEGADDNFAMIKESQEGMVFGGHISRQDVHPLSTEDDVALELISVSVSKERSRAGRISRGHKGNLAYEGQEHDEESSSKTVFSEGYNDDVRQPSQEKNAQGKRNRRQVSLCWWSRLFKWRVFLAWWQPRWHRVFALGIALPVAVVAINKLCSNGKEDKGPYLVAT